mmetsp:Transcript_33937/g.55848  ORF Transcript_33937/g.55848 Transcript_33937/m.55848 type:complete len:339 (-) Transcript_33937:109-1125(-)
MHGVALPDHWNATRLDCLDVAGQRCLDLLGTIARDDNELAFFLIWVQDLDNLRKLLWLHRRTNLHTDRVLNASEVFDVSAIQLSRAIANPKHVSTEIVEFVSNLPCQSLFQIELHALVRREELSGSRRRRVLIDNFFRLLLKTVKIWCAGKQSDLDTRQVDWFCCSHEAAKEIQCGGRVPVSQQESLWVPLALRGVEAINIVALERHDLSKSLDHLRGLAARLAILTSDAADDTSRLVHHMLDHHAHLQHELELRLQAVSLTVHETLGAVAPLHDESFASCGLRQQLFQSICLFCLHKRRQLANLSEHLLGNCCVLPLGHLQPRLSAPRRRLPLCHLV